MLALDWQERLALDAAEECRALRTSLDHRSQTQLQHLKRQKRQLHDEEFYQLLREQQQLLEDQKKQLQEQQRLLEEKDQELRKQHEQMLEDRATCRRWEDLAESRGQQLHLEESHLAQLEERLAEGVDAFAEQHNGYALCVQQLAEARRSGEELRLGLEEARKRHGEELRTLKDSIQPLRPGPSRCCLVAAPAARPVLWGSIPLLPQLQDAACQTDSDAVVLDLEHQLRRGGTEKEQLELEIQSLKELLEEKVGVEDLLAEAHRRLELPEHVLHSELKQAHADLRDKDASVRLQEDRALSLHESCEKRLEAMREQSQQLLEQTRVQASQSAADLVHERRRGEEVALELREVSNLREELQGIRDELRLSREEACIDAASAEEAMSAQQELYAEHCSRLQQEERLRESITKHLKESWRRNELQPALDEAKTLRRVMDEDQRYAENLQLENHAILLQAAEKQAQLSFSSTEMAFAKAEVEAWRSRGLRMLEEKMLQEALLEEQRFLDACPEVVEAVQRPEASLSALLSTVDTTSQALADVQPDKE